MSSSYSPVTSTFLASVIFSLVLADVYRMSSASFILQSHNLCQNVKRNCNSKQFPYLRTLLRLFFKINSSIVWQVFAPWRYFCSTSKAATHELLRLWNWTYGYSILCCSTLHESFSHLFKKLVLKKKILLFNGHTVDNKHDDVFFFSDSVDKIQFCIRNNYKITYIMNFHDHPATYNTQYIQ